MASEAEKAASELWGAAFSSYSTIMGMEIESESRWVQNSTPFFQAAIDAETKRLREALEEIAHWPFHSGAYALEMLDAIRAHASEALKGDDADGKA